MGTTSWELALSIKRNQYDPKPRMINELLSLGILRDKTMDDKLYHPSPPPNDDKPD